MHTFVFVTTFCNSSLRRRGLGAFALRTFGWRICQSSGWRLGQFAAFEVGDWADSRLATEPTCTGFLVGDCRPVVGERANYFCTCGWQPADLPLASASAIFLTSRGTVGGVPQSSLQQCNSAAYNPRHGGSVEQGARLASQSATGKGKSQGPLARSCSGCSVRGSSRLRCAGDVCQRIAERPDEAPQRPSGQSMGQRWEEGRQSPQPKETMPLLRLMGSSARRLSQDFCLLLRMWRTRTLGPHVHMQEQCKGQGQRQ